MNFLITGGAGFIGSNFIRCLLSEDVDNKVIVLDALTYAGNIKNLSDFIVEDNFIIPASYSRLINIKTFADGGYKLDNSIDLESRRLDYKLKEQINPCHVSIDSVSSVVFEMLSEKRIVFVLGNIIDNELVCELMKVCDMVVNFAAETHVDRSILNPGEFIKTDVYGTYILLEASRNCKDFNRFIHISTDEVYGDASEKSFTENDSINPRNPYSASKAAADRLVYAYNQTYGLPVNIIRPSNNFGPFQYPEKLIPLMIIKALANDMLPVYGDGRQIRDWLFVEDTARAINLVINKAESGAVYNVAGKNEKENIQVVRYILNKLGKSEELIKYVKDRPGHDRKYSLDDTKIRTELGYSQAGNLEERLDWTIQWYLDNQGWWENIINEDVEYNKFMKSWYKDRS